LKMQPQTTQTSSATQTLGLILINQFSMIAFTSLVEPLRLANHVAGKRLYDWRLYSIDGLPVEAPNGMRIEVGGSIADVGPMPNVVVCSGIDVQKQELGPLIAKLRRLAFYGVSLGAVCTGAHILAKARLLDSHRCTVHWENQDALREEYPELEVTDELFEIDRNRFTCAGGTAAIDMMLTMIAKTHGQAIAAAVTDELIHHRMRGPNERQRMELRSRLGVANPKVLAIVAMMEKTLEEPLSCADLAEEADLSPRQLERLFQRYLGETPTRYYLSLRLERARALLMQTSMPVLSVGLACGFVSASHFSKCYHEHFGRTPSEERFGPRNSDAGARKKGIKPINDNSPEESGEAAETAGAVV
jgi:AraC family transcriptional regulator, glycine betaine-responsive activator